MNLSDVLLGFVGSVLVIVIILWLMEKIKWIHEIRTNHKMNTTRYDFECLGRENNWTLDRYDNLGQYKDTRVQLAWTTYCKIRGIDHEKR